MKLAIVVVYFLTDERMPVLDLHLRSLVEHTTGPFRILGTAPRVSEAVRERLLACDALDLLALDPTSASGSFEHSHYLNLLCDHAVAQGYERICLMDVDAFPIRGGWNERLEAYLRRGDQVAAVFRAENDDTALPHPSCCYFSADFYRRYRPRFLPEGYLPADPVYGEFLARTKQRADSGIGLGLVLWQHQLPWARLMRSNRRNDHYLLAGVYDDLIFHLGAMSWIDRDFRKDRRASLVLRGLDTMAASMRRAGLFKGPVAALWWRVNQAATRGLVQRTNETHRRVVEQLTRDPQSYIASLTRES